MFGPKEIIIIVGLFLVLFGGRGKISSIMGDLANGIKSFKKGIKDDPKVETDSDMQIDVTPPKKEKTKS
ncbi:MAG: twin-arginine translocase TatA/TatE family subunit [Robiginitomaculum sp.]